MVEQLPKLDYSNNLQDGCIVIHKEPRTTLYLPFLQPKTKSRKKIVGEEEEEQRSKTERK